MYIHMYVYTNLWFSFSLTEFNKILYQRSNGLTFITNGERERGGREGESDRCLYNSIHTSQLVKVIETHDTDKQSYHSPPPPPPPPLVLYSLSYQELLLL